MVHVLTIQDSLSYSQTKHKINDRMRDIWIKSPEQH